MDHLLIIAGIGLLICLVATRVFGKFGVPSLLAFILLGMVFGEDGPLGIAFSNYELCEHICTVGLVFIMFYGGFGAKWSAARPYAAESILLASAGTVLTALVVALGAHLILGMDLAHSFLLGSLISSTDAASVFSVLRARRLNLKDGLASVLEVESGSNDPFAYLLTFIALLFIEGTATPAAVVLTLVSQLLIGAAVGVGLALASLLVLGRLRDSDDALASALLIAAALLSFSIPEISGGNGFLSVYLTGLIIGNSRRVHGKAAIVHFFDGLTHISQMMIFFLFGLLSFPSNMLAVLPQGLVVFVVLTFVARPLGAALVGRLFGRSWAQVAFISTAGLRGAASLTFALIALESLSSAGMPTGFGTYHTVLWVVIFSILLQGVALPFCARRLDLVDDSQSVMRTFTDYEELDSYSLLELTVHPGGKWDGKAVRDAGLPSGMLAMLIRRGDQSIVPHGDTQLLAGDQIVMSAPSYTPAPGRDRDSTPLRELFLGEGHPWVGRTLSQVPLSPGGLAVLIRRQDDAVLPHGSTMLQAGDVVVYSGSLPRDMTPASQR